MNPNRKYGEGTLKADGETFGMTKISYSLNGPERSETDNGQGYETKTKGGHVKGTVELCPGMSIEKLKAMDDVTVVWDTYTGQTYTDRKSTRLNSSHTRPSRMPSSA